VILAPGFEEIEATTVIDILRRCGVEVVTAGLRPDPVEGAHGIKYIPDSAVERVAVREFDAVILPGGAPGYENLRRDQRVLEMVREAFESNKIVAAICAAPAVLSTAGILRGKTATIYPEMEEELKKGGCKPKRGAPVVVDGNIVTSRGVATALYFSFELAERLAGKAAARDVRKRTLANLALK